MIKTMIAAGTAALCLAAGVASAEGESTLEHIRETGTLTVGTEAAYPPFEFVDDEGNIVGYGKDILDVVVEELGDNVELDQKDVPFQGILPGLLADKFDFVATTVSINEDRAKRYAFTLPISNGQPYIMTRKGEGAAIESENDLAGMKVGTQLASSGEPVTKALNERLTDEGNGFSDLKLYPSYTDSYVALASGEIDAVIQPLPPLAVLVKERPETFEISAPVETGVSWTYQGWVTRPDDIELREAISDIIRKMRDDGRLYELQEKWFGFKMEIPDEGYLPEGSY